MADDRVVETQLAPPRSLMIPAAVKLFECEATRNAVPGRERLAGFEIRDAEMRARERRAPLAATARTQPGSSVARI